MNRQPVTFGPGGADFHPRLVEAAIALNDNRLDIAERLLKPHLHEDPYDVAAIRMLAELAARIGRWRDSENLLRRAVELAPDWIAAKANLALVLGRMGRPAEAMELLDGIFEAEPEEIGHWNLKAATLGRMGEFDEAIALYEGVLERAPDQPRVWLSYGHMLKTVGRLDEGVAAYRRAIAIRRELGEAWWSLANLKTVRFEPEDIAAMRLALSGGACADEDRVHLLFALGKAMHDEGKAGEAFAFYSEGNALRRGSEKFNAADISATVDRSIAQFTQERMAKASGGCDARDPIFIVGMPRSGSTLIEQILASHSMIEGTSELPDIPALARGLGPYPKSILAMSAEERAELGRTYLKRASVQRRTGKPLFVDKLPNNWLFVPFIRLILPNARIIDARRHPMACGLSNYRQLFARGQAFSYGLEDMGSYYRDYVRLMAHVDHALPGWVHRTVYEDMVEDTEAQVRALLDFVGVPFETACLEFHRTERAVRTPSSEQVRRPIYRESTASWSAYDSHLGPLRDALGDDVLQSYPAAPRDFLATKTK